MENINNVIQFPKNSVSGKFTPVNQEQITDKMLDVKHTHINEALATVIPMVFSYLEIAGFEFSEEVIEDDSEHEYFVDNNVKDGAFLVESIRSMMCKYHGIDHPFQELADNIFIKDEKENNVFRIADSVNITFKNDEKGNS